MTTVLIPPQRVPVSKIAVSDKDTMARAAMNADSVKACADRWKEAGPRTNPFSEAPDPITLFLDGDGNYWVGDGRHRVSGAIVAERDFIEAIVNDGTKWDALEFALKCNTENGTSYTQRDHAVRVKKMHALHPEWSDNRMSKELKLPLTTLNRIRSKLIVKEDNAAAPVTLPMKPAKDNAEAKEQTETLKKAVRAKTAANKKKAAPAKVKPDAPLKVTDSEHVKGVAASFAKLGQLDASIQNGLSRLVKDIDERLAITRESDVSPKLHAAIIQQLDLVLVTWKQWKKDG